MKAKMKIEIEIDDADLVLEILERGLYDHSEIEEDYGLESSETLEQMCCELGLCYLAVKNRLRKSMGDKYLADII